MKTRFLTTLLAAGTLAVALAAAPTDWEPDEIVSPASGCIFESFEIPPQVFARMQGKSYKDDCTVPLSSLRYLRVMHHDGKGNVRVGEVVCHVSIADDLVDIFRNLYDASYPIERMVLIDEYDALDVPSMEANNSSSFNFRVIAGTDRLSNHAEGKAIDINPLYNPWVKRGKNGKVSVSPKCGRPYADRSLKDSPYPLIDTDDEAYRQFTSHGFVWGGSWNSSKDYQHFEKK